MSFKEKVNSLKEKTAQVYLCMKSKKCPWYAKVNAALTIAYALSPIDLIPDFIPILGYLDDLIILPLMIYVTIKMVPKDLWDSYSLEAKEMWKDGKPKKWYYAIPILIIWIALICLIIYLILKNNNIIG